MEISVTTAEMRAYDKYAIEKLKIPGLVLMENAGRSVAEAILRHYGPVKEKSVLIFCGKGNNGGDGFVAARYLHNRGANITIALTGKKSQLKGDARTNYEILRELVKNVRRPSVLRIVELQSRRILSMLPQPQIIVDAIFGTGFSGEVGGLVKDVIGWINKSKAWKISIDVPSGVGSNNGDITRHVVKADLCITLGFNKNDLFVGNTISYTNKLEVVDIELPNQVLKAKPPKTYIVSMNDVRIKLPVRSLNAHKHSVGKVFILAGARGFAGAAIMASTAGMKAGAGSVVLGVPYSVYPIVAKKMIEIMVEPLQETSDGTLGLASIKKIREFVDWADVIIVGPGLSRHAETQKVVCKIVTEVTKSTIIDADGLNALAANISALKRHKSKHLILTPHTGEFSRLSKLSITEIENNRIEVAREFAKKFRLTLVLKGSPTVTASGNGEVFINSTGNPGMATAGSGDVLTGLIGGLFAQKMQQTEAAYSGAFLHGRAGDLAKIKFGEKSMMAMDILRFIPAAIQETEQQISL